MRKLSLILLSVFLLVGCELVGGDYVRGSGNVVGESRPVDGAFTGVVLATSGDVTLIQGEERAIEIEAEDNVLPHLTTEVRNGVLTLGTEVGASLQTREPIRYTITLPEIELLRIAGSGDIESERIVGEDLDLEIGGSGDMRLASLSARRLQADIDGSGGIAVAGEVQEQTIAINGSGDFEGQELVSEQAEVTINGSGTTTVWVADRLTAAINGSGDVIYYGDPQVEQEINGSGDLEQRGGR